MASLGDAIAFVEGAGAALGIARQDVLRLAFIVEELFTNTVTHGHGGDTSLPVTLTLALGDGCALLTYADSAPPHNPLDGLHAEPATLASTLQMRPVGGLGTYLVGQLIETGRYSHQGGRNVLNLSLPLAG